MKKINDERIVQKDYETTTRTFVLLALLCLGYVIFYNKFTFFREEPQITVFLFLIISSIYFVIDSFFSRTLLPDVQGKLDIKNRFEEIAISIVSFDIVLIYLLFRGNNLETNFSKLVPILLGIIGLDIILFVISYLLLNLWVKWLNK